MSRDRAERTGGSKRASESERAGAEGVGTLTDPDLAAAREFLESALDATRYVSVVGECTVEYSGRATSTLGAGRRHVIVKPDRTVLVHEADGHQPVNWQPPGGSIGVDAESAHRDADTDSFDGSDPDGDQHDDVDADGAFVLRANRESPEESLAVRFSTVHQASAYEIGETSSPETVGTEADLKAHVLDSPDVIEPGLQPLATERETPAGPVDVYAEDADGRPVVVELKRTRVGPDAVGQLSRYVDALDRELHADAEPRGILVAPSVTDRARQLLAEEGLEYAAVEPPESK